MPGKRAGQGVSLTSYRVMRKIGFSAARWATPWGMEQGVDGVRPAHGRGGESQVLAIIRLWSFKWPFLKAAADSALWCSVGICYTL